MLIVVGQLIGQIEDAEYLKEEYLSIDHTNFKFPSLRDENLSKLTLNYKTYTTSFHPIIK